MRTVVSLRAILILALFNTTSVRAGRVLLALFALDLGASPVTIGLIAATFSAFPMVASWGAGRLADRYGARWLLLLGALGGGAGLLVPFFAPGLPALFVAAAMNGLSFTFYNVSMQAQVGLLSAAENRAANFGSLSLMLAVATFFGPLIAGVSVDHAGHARACLVVAVLTLVPIAMLLARGAALPAGAPQVEAPGSLREVLTTPGLARLLLTGSLVVAGIDLFQFYLPIYGHGVGLSATEIGVVLAMFSAAAVVVRAIMPRILRRHRETTVLAAALWIGAGSLLLVPLFDSALALGCIAFLFGLGMGCGQPITMKLTFDGALQGRAGEFVGVRISVNHLTRVVAPVVFGLIASGFGLTVVFIVNALMLAGGSRFVLKRAGPKT